MPETFYKTDLRSEDYLLLCKKQLIKAGLQTR